MYSSLKINVKHLACRPFPCATQVHVLWSQMELEGHQSQHTGITCFKPWLTQISKLPSLHKSPIYHQMCDKTIAQGFLAWAPCSNRAEEKAGCPWPELVHSLLISKATLCWWLAEKKVPVTHKAENHPMGLCWVNAPSVPGSGGNDSSPLQSLGESFSVQCWPNVKCVSQEGFCSETIGDVCLQASV